MHFTPSIVLGNIGADTNVFNEVSDPKQDTTATLGPAVHLGIRLGRSRLTGSASGLYIYYNKYDALRRWSTIDDAKWELPLSRITPFLTGTYTNTRDRAGFEIDARVHQTGQTIGLGTEVRLSSRTSVVVSAKDAKVLFDQNETFFGTNLARALNRDATSAQLQFLRVMTPLTTFVLSGEGIQDRFSNDPIRSSDSVQVMTGFQLKPSALISGTAMVGFRSFNPLDTSVPDFRGVVASIDARYTVRATQFGARVARDLAYSFEPTQPYFALTDWGVSVTERISLRWDLVGRSAWQRLAYRQLETPTIATVPVVPPAPQRVDQGSQYGGGIGFRAARTMRIGFDVNYFKRTSPESLRQYSGLRFGGSVSYGLPQ